MNFPFSVCALDVTSVRVSQCRERALWAMVSMHGRCGDVISMATAAGALRAARRDRLAASRAYKSAGREDAAAYEAYRGGTTQAPPASTALVSE